MSDPHEWTSPAQTTTWEATHARCGVRRGPQCPKNNSRVLHEWSGMTRTNGHRLRRQPLGRPRMHGVASVADRSVQKIIQGYSTSGAVHSSAIKFLKQYVQVKP